MIWMRGRAILFFLMELGILGTVGQLGLNTSSNVPLRYTESSVPGMSWIHYPGKMIDPSDAFSVRDLNTVCQCRTDCWSIAMCTSFSTMPSGDLVECSLSSKDPTNLILVDQADAEFSIRIESLSDVVFETSSGDGYHYLVYSKLADYSTAKELCPKMPGYYLGMFKTVQQVKSLSKAGELSNLPLLVDLVKLSHVPFEAEWGDGSPCVNEILADGGVGFGVDIVNEERFRFQHGLLMDADVDRKFPYICQAYIGP